MKIVTVLGIVSPDVDSKYLFSSFKSKALIVTEIFDYNQNILS